MTGIHGGDESSLVKAEGEKNKIYIYLHHLQNQDVSDEQNRAHADQSEADIMYSRTLLKELKQNESFYIERGGGKEFHEYFALLRERIIYSKQYPKRARWLKISGKNRVSFFVHADGNVDNIRIVHGSGYPILDRESCNAIKRAGPFPPIPSDMYTGHLEMAVTLKYEL